MGRVSRRIDIINGGFSIAPMIEEKDFSLRNAKLFAVYLKFPAVIF